MQDLEKNREDLKIDLFSGNTDLVLETIELIKLSSHFEIIDSLFDLYLTTQKQEIKSQLFSLFIDIKDKRFVQKLVDSLSKPKFSTISKDLISISWQTGLDFCDHLDLFVQKMIEGNDEIAIECFSVIENAIDDLSDDRKKELSLVLQANLTNSIGVKKGMIEETIHILG
jgi:hypothetical protein